MSNKGLVSAFAIITCFSGSCTSEDCNKSRMIDIIRQDIKDNNRNYEEYKIGTISRRADGIYIAMEQKAVPSYYRHYLINPRTCKILDLKIDQ
jgi:hypothetical protein